MGTRWTDHVTLLYSQTVALTSPTSGCFSVGVVRLRTKDHGICFLFVSLLLALAVILWIGKKLKAGSAVVRKVLTNNTTYFNPSIMEDEYEYSIKTNWGNFMQNQGHFSFFFSGYHLDIQWNKLKLDKYSVTSANSGLGLNWMHLRWMLNAVLWWWTASVV
jgi:hypothetical protein